MQWTDRVVVITGATSGIGRATALAFAARGAHVVLAGRREQALISAAHACRQAGGTVSIARTDVTHEGEVQALAQVALQHSGVIDVWINNAGVTLFGALEDAPMEGHRRVIETNLFGAIHGARAVLPVFRRQRRGVLIDVGSVLSQIGQPFVPSYVISKFGLRGLTEALRAEVAHEPDIHICTVLPYAVDTEHFEAGANYLGREPHAMPPAQSPEEVARAVLRLAEHPTRERYVPRAARFGVWLHSVFPRAVERVLQRSLGKWHLGGPSVGPRSGNLHRPQTLDGDVRGQRPPIVSTARLLAYAVPRLLTTQAELTLRDLRRALRPRRAVDATRPSAARLAPTAREPLDPHAAAPRLT